jgi:hypothetical protein
MLDCLLFAIEFAKHMRFFVGWRGSSKSLVTCCHLLTPLSSTLRMTPCYVLILVNISKFLVCIIIPKNLKIMHVEMFKILE